MRREHIHTVYDRLDAKGYFAQNPANTDSRDKLTGESLYKGPVAFPKMMYHPEAKRRVLTAASPGQREITEIINKVVNNEAEYKELREKGWHDHPADALTAAGQEAPAKGSVDRVAQLERELAAKNKELEGLRAGALQNDSADEDEE